MTLYQPVHPLLPPGPKFPSATEAELWVIENNWYLSGWDWKAVSS